jgi:DNA-binding transcriptional LysR family regulator
MTEAQLRALVAVAEEGSFAAAASALCMSQPGVSRSIKSLELELGGALFARQGVHVALTQLGEAALVRARAMLSEADAMRHELAGLGGEARGKLRLGSMPSVSSTLLPAIVARVARRHPAVRLTVIDGHDDELVRWLRDGIVDVAVVAGEPEGLELQTLVVDEFLAVLPADHPLAAHESVDRRALADEPFILTRAGCERLILQALAEAGVVPSVSHEVTEASAIVALVSEGAGVSIVPSLAVGDSRSSVALRPLRPAAPRRLSLATRAGRSPSPAAAALLAEAGRVGWAEAPGALAS